MSAHHKDPEYIRNSRAVRLIVNGRLASGSYVVCVNCGRAVQAGQRFDVGHIIDAAKGGSHSMSNLGAAHRKCNRSAGGKAGAALTNRSSRRARRLPSWLK